MNSRHASSSAHSHVFLGESHDRNERRTWAVIVLCSVMMIAEIVGGLMFGSIALVADGLHMSTHASALLLAAAAYWYARRHADDPRFSFGTGKLGDIAGFSSAIVLAMISLLIGYEAIARLIEPVPISFKEAIPIAVLGLIVNIISVLLLSGGHDHHHGHGHGHGESEDDHDAVRRFETDDGTVTLQVFEGGAPPRFRLFPEDRAHALTQATIETVRSTGERQVFATTNRGAFLESVEEIPEPHDFTALVRLGDQTYSVEFEEHEHGGAATHRDNNMRAAIVHILADGVVSLLVIVGLLLARYFGWLFMDPVAGICGAVVIAAWSYGLIRDTGRVLLDMNPDRRMADRVRATIECEGDRVEDLHLWRLGPGHMGAILSITTAKPRNPGYYRRLLARFRSLSHVTVEVEHG